MESTVKDIVQRAHSKSEELRKNKRLEAQSSKRNLSKDDFNHEISEKEAKTLFNLCKSGKLSVAQLRDLSQALSSKPEFSTTFLNSDGCLHGLVGFLSGSDPSKQVVAVQCLVNLAGQGYKCPLVAKSAGAYLVTLTAGTNKILAEHSCLVISNLCLGDRLAVPILLGLDAVQNLVNLAETSADSVQEAALQALYHLVSGEQLSPDTARTLVTSATRLLSAVPPRDLPPIHLLWLLYLLSSQQPLHNFLAHRTFIHQCLDLATYEIFQKCDSRPLVKLLTPVVRILANLAAGPDSGNAAEQMDLTNHLKDFTNVFPVSVSVCLCLVRHPDLAAILTALLSTNYLHLCREALWLFANIVNNESVTVQEEFVNLDLMDKLETHAVHAVGRLDPYALG